MIKKLISFLKSRRFEKDVAREIAGQYDSFLAQENAINYLFLPQEYVWKVKEEAIFREIKRLNREISSLTGGNN